VTVKRVDDGRVSNWINDRVAAGDTLMVTPPAGLFVLTPDDRKLVFFAGGSGITPVVSLIKSALADTKRAAKLVYANRDADSIIFREELEAIAAAHPGRLEVAHSLDAVDGYVNLHRVKAYVGDDLDADFYLCGPGIFMSTVEEALRELHVEHEHIHIERFVSPPDPGPHPAEAPEPVTTDEGEDVAPDVISVVLDGATHEVPYPHGEKVINAVRAAGHEPPFSCEEGYCSCCMAKLVAGEVKMDTNDCLTPELLEEGWILTCQARCVRGRVRIEFPD
jgi:3-ketosteroid 9alpha-monooxygenase subunit B